MWAWLKRTFGGGGLCVPDETQNVTLTPPAPRGNDVSSFSGTQGLQDESTDHTPLPLAFHAGVLSDHSQHGAAAVHQGAADTQAEEDQTPPLQVVSADRYIVSGGMPVGIANTVSKYRETQPLVPHLTPFEQRVAAKLTEEQQVAAAAAAAAATAATEAASSDADNGSTIHVRQKLFTASDLINGSGRAS